MAGVFIIISVEANQKGKGVQPAHPVRGLQRPVEECTQPHARLGVSVARSFYREMLQFLTALTASLNQRRFNASFGSPSTRFFRRFGLLLHRRGVEHDAQSVIDLHRMKREAFFASLLCLHGQTLATVSRSFNRFPMVIGIAVSNRSPSVIRRVFHRNENSSA